MSKREVAVTIEKETEQSRSRKSAMRKQFSDLGISWDTGVQAEGEGHISTKPKGIKRETQLLHMNNARAHAELSHRQVEEQLAQLEKQRQQRLIQEETDRQEQALKLKQQDLKPGDPTAYHVVIEAAPPINLPLHVSIFEGVYEAFLKQGMKGVTEYLDYIERVKRAERNKRQ